MKTIFLQRLCKLTFVLGTILVGCTNAFGQAWFPADTAWKGTGSFNWTFKARNGIRNDSGYSVAATKYFVNDRIRGFMEYLPAGYNDPANTNKTWPTIIYFPGCGEIQNGVMYIHPDGTPNYYYGMGRFFAQGNPPNLKHILNPVLNPSFPESRFNIGGAQQVLFTEIWQADQYVLDTLDGGVPSTQVTTSITAANTLRPTLYQSAREGSGFRYRIPVKNNERYQVVLHFVETVFNVAGQRVFNIKVNGGSTNPWDNGEFNGFDILGGWGAVPKNTARQQSLNVYVVDGYVNVLLQGTIGKAILSAIEIIQPRPGTGFPSMPTFIRDNGDYFSRVPKKTLGQSYNPATDPKEGFVILCMMQAGDPSVCENFFTFPLETDVDAVLAMAQRNYRVNTTKMYLTGMSSGGIISYSYPGSDIERARKLAAVAPVAATSGLTANQQAYNIVYGGTSLLAVVNENDIQPNGSNRWLTNKSATDLLTSVNNTAPVKVDIQFYDFIDGNLGTHNGWETAYFPEHPFWATNPRYVFTDPTPGGGPENYSLYEWFLLHQNQAAALPVLVKTFTAQRVDNGVDINWATSLESNSSFFTLERSSDGMRFNQLTMVPAAGNSSTERKYKYLDNNLPGSPYVYYRLTQTDKDGKKQVFGIRKVYIGTNGFEVRVYPTITTGSLTLEVQGVTSDPLTLRIVDLSGKLLKLQIIAPRQNRVSLDVSGLAKGMYIIHASNNVYQYTTKFVKQ